MKGDGDGCDDREIAKCGFRVHVRPASEPVPGSLWLSLSGPSQTVQSLGLSHLIAAWASVV